eukprot:m.162928 g.162928  ORF g.162928 m.162928 type:complete len:936 (-) comp17100_c0_seq1:283-3090(-)
MAAAPVRSLTAGANDMRQFSIKGGTRRDIEKAELEQGDAISRTINKQEKLIPAKYIRTMVVGTWKARSCQPFFQRLFRLRELEESPVMIYKTLTVIHHLLHDGYPTILNEIWQLHREAILRLGDVASRSQHPYGKISGQFAQMLVKKLEFHHLCPSFAGNLADEVVFSEYESGEQVKLLDSFLAMQQMNLMTVLVVFSTCDSYLELSDESKACIQSPLATIVNESIGVYEKTAQILAVLHERQKPETLQIERIRFEDMHKKLHSFYDKARRAPVLAGLQFPELSKEPPSFLKPLTEESLRHARVNTSNAIPDDFFGEAFKQKEMEDMRDELEMCKAKIASLELALREAESALGAIDPEILAEIESQMLSHGASKYEGAVRAYVELKSKYGALAQANEELRQQLARETAARESVQQDSQNSLLDAVELAEASSKEAEDFKAQLSSVQAELVALKEEVQQKDKAITVMDTTASNAIQQVAQLEEKVRELTAQQIEQLREMANVQAENTRLIAEGIASKESLGGQTEHLQKEIDELRRRLQERNLASLAITIEHCQATVKKITNDDDSGSVGSIAGLEKQKQELQQKLAETRKLYDEYNVKDDPTAPMYTSPLDAANMLLSICQLSKATSLSENVKVPEVKAMCESLAATADEYFKSLLPGAGTRANGPQLEGKLKSLLNDLHTALGDVVAAAEKKSHALSEEMDYAQQMVDEATKRMEEMMQQARAAMTEQQLSVNGVIMDSSVNLMRLIKLLISQAGVLQSEIVKAETMGKGHVSVAQFYKKNSRWVDGLLSAAKAVGGGATVLVDTADGVLGGRAKFEELMVCGQEIAASTVQLVTASRVKAPSRNTLAPLEDTSKKVSDATKALINAAREAGAKTSTAKSAQDYLKLSLTQARRLEMDSQVRVLELESELGRERERLGQLRRVHYHLEGEQAST